MIINSLWAENVLKYSTLRLDDVPDRGLIAVVGDNESGKSSIGESICFALFGRTFSLDSEDLDKVIRWGESRCSIKLDFTTPNGQRYQVARFLDELGNHGASISRAGEEPMVRGVGEVAASLRDIIGFGYTEFIESFYLAQREITTPHPHSFAVKAMAGVDALEKVVSSCETELGRTRTQKAETERERADIQTQINALDLQVGYLASLESERAAETDAREQDRGRIANLKTASEKGDRAIGALREGAAKWLAVTPAASFNTRLAQVADLNLLVSDLEPQSTAGGQTAAACAELGELARASRERITAFDALRQRAGSYRDWLERLLNAAETEDGESDEQTFAARRAELTENLVRTGSSRRTARILMFVLLLSALAVWVPSGLLGLAPESPLGRAVAGWLTGIEENWEGLVIPWLPVIASVLSLLFLGFLVRNVSLGSRLQGLGQSRKQLDDEEAAARREVSELARLDDMPLPEAAVLLAGLRDEAIAGHVPDFQQGPGGALLDPERNDAIQAQFRRITDRLREEISHVKEAAAREIEGLHDSVANHASAIARLDGMIAQERERVRRHEELTGIADSLQAKIDELDHRARVRGLAMELTHGAIHYIAHRFNTEVRNLSADSLPKFTNGRYEHLQIDENLKVKAFSNEKRDFMDLDEISSGTQRQIMLAVRMSLSQKLVNSVIQGPQTLFLDEPFAFFDERRTASALAVLPKVSGDFSQIWVTSQTFPTESRFDLYVECNAEETKSPVVRRGETVGADAMTDG